ncbi:MAG TPA: hypothetical protein PLB12_08215 [Candidatus Goldiibacteriota bacterium]|nr:hypothetical protein [Candidatus Goldiibacteriota bacterium]
MTAPVIKRKKILITAAIAALAVFLPVIISAQPYILDLSIDPPNPNFGESAVVKITYCSQCCSDGSLAMAISTSPTLLNAQLSGQGQMFVVYGKQNVACQSNLTPVGMPGGTDNSIGCEANNQSGVTTGYNCTLCGGGQGFTYYREYTIKVPSADSFPGCTNTTLYLHAGMKDSNIGGGEWVGFDGTCQHDSTSWTIPLLPPDFTINKKVEGNLQDAGDLFVYSIDYSYQNGQLVITDPLNFGVNSANVSIVSAGPSGIVGSYTVGPLPQTLTWTLPNRTNVQGKAEGTVWVLLRMNTDIADNTLLSNTATGKIGSTTKTSAANLRVGEPALNISKSETVTQVGLHDTITYLVEYDLQGSKLIVYEPFDNNPTGPANPPAGWSIAAPGGVGDGWTIEDPCGTGDRYLRGSSPLKDYPGLVHNDPATFCTGIIVTDVMIEASYEGADALVFIRNNNVSGAGAIAYSAVLSVDVTIGGNGNGSLGFQRCNGDPATCIWPASGTTPMDIETNKWYTMKVEALGDYQFRAKVWVKGDPEPGGWVITWTDTSPPANSSCASDTWKTGVANQGGDNCCVDDLYNNFVIYEPRFTGNEPITVTDDYPEDQLTFRGSSSPLPHTISNNGSQWTSAFTVAGDEAGTFTWWAEVTSCDPITNRASINGVGVTQVSNDVVLTVNCIEDVTLVKTANPNLIDLGDIVTFTLCWENTGELPSNIVVTDPIPPRTTVTAINNGGTGVSIGATSGTITWNIGTQNPGASGCVSWAGRIN